MTDLPDDIDVLRHEIDRMDAVILAAVKRRSAVSKKIGAARMASGGPRLVHSREVKVLDRFSDLGQEGHTWRCCCCGSAGTTGPLTTPGPVDRSGYRPVAPRPRERVPHHIGWLP